MGKKYLVLCNRHNSVYGDNWALFWGCRNSQGGYNSDLRTAHRYDESEIGGFKDNQDIPIPIDVLGISEEYESEETINKNIVVMIEKGTLNKLLNLNLRPLFVEEEVCCNNCEYTENEGGEGFRYCTNSDSQYYGYCVEDACGLCRHFKSL